MHMANRGAELLTFPLATRNLAEVATYLGPIAPGLSQWSGIEVTDITSDSSSVMPGSLFVALRGLSRHGAEFVDEALKLGAIAVLTDREGEKRITDRSMPIITVSRPEVDLGHLAHWFYGNPMDHMHSVGITGTNGKTTTTTLLYEIWQAAGFTSALMGTVATRMPGIEIEAARTTESADLIARRCAQMSALHVRSLAMEVSSHGLALNRINGAKFAAVGFTNLSQDHLDFHGDMESYFAAKARLFSHEFSSNFASKAFINIDDAYGARLERSCELELHSLSLKDKRATWFIQSFEATRLGYRLAIRGPQGILIETEIKLRGQHNLENFLMALALAHDSGVDPLLLAEISPTLQGAPGRLERIDLGQPFDAYVDYAHSPDAVAHVLSALRQSMQSSLEGGKGKLIAVLGCGGDRDRGKRPLMGNALLGGADVAVFTSDNPRSEEPAAIIKEMIAGNQITTPNKVEEDRAEAIRYAVSIAQAGDTIVILGKGHEQGQKFADRLIPFDDRIELAKAIESYGKRS